MKSIRFLILGPVALLLNACINTQTPTPEGVSSPVMAASVPQSAATTQSITSPETLNLVPMSAVTVKNAGVIAQAVSSDLPNASETNQPSSVQPYQTTLYLVAPSAKIRNFYSEDSPVLCERQQIKQISIDDHIELGPTNDWYRTRICGANGWISGKSLSVNPVADDSTPVR